MKVPAIVKLIGLSVFSVALVLATDLKVLAVLVVLLLGCAVFLRPGLVRLFRMLVPALPFIVLIAAFQWLLSGPGTAGLSFARMLLLYVAGSTITATTTETEFVGAVKTLLWPVKKLTGTSIDRDIATMMVLAIAFLPIIKEEHDSIRLAQEARGLSFEGPAGYLKGEICTIVPLINAISERADRIALAMEARCYGLKPEKNEKP